MIGITNPFLSLDRDCKSRLAGFGWHMWLVCDATTASLVGAQYHQPLQNNPILTKIINKDPNIKSLKLGIFVEGDGTVNLLKLID